MYGVLLFILMIISGVILYFIRYIWLYPIRENSEVQNIFIQFKLSFKKFYRNPIISLLTDDGGEYQAMEQFLSTNGISHLASPSYTLVHNDFFEKTKFSYCWNVANLSTLCFYASHNWPHTFETILYPINRVSKVQFSIISSFDKLLNRPLALSKLKIWMLILSLATSLFVQQTQV